MTAVPAASVGDPRAAADSEAVTQLVLRERQTRDRGWYDDMAQCFTTDATITMSWFRGAARDFIATTRARTADGVWGRHRLSPPVVRVDQDRAWAEVALGIEFAVEVGGTPADLISYCRSQYRAERTESGWRIAAITSIYERDTLAPRIPGTTLDLDHDALTVFRPSYRNLAWYFAQQGTPLPNDLLGDDAPAPVAAQYRREFAWLNGEDVVEAATVR